MTAQGLAQSPCSLLRCGPAELDRGTERRFIVIIRAAVERCQGWMRWLVFPRWTLRYTPTRHGGSARDFPPAIAHTHRGTLTIRPQFGRPRHHAIVLEPCPRAGARLAPPADEGRRTQHLGRRGGQHLRTPRQRRPRRPHRLPHRYGAERWPPRRRPRRPGRPRVSADHPRVGHAHAPAPDDGGLERRGG